MIKIDLIPVLQDNYVYVLTDDNGGCAIVDPGEAEPVIAYMDKNGLKPDAIFITHHHWDHINGAPALIKKYAPAVYGPAADKHRIPFDYHGLGEGDVIDFGGEQAVIMETPGHTLGHICYHFAKSKILLCGDTLFSMGCGRLFEGTPDQMWMSLSKIMLLPADTKICCTHEYTKANAEFCLTVEPDNTDLQARYDEVVYLRDLGQPTVPALLETELKTNAFLRAETAERFATLRKMKDSF